MPVYTDQLGRVVELNQVPKKIISLVPSQTELLFYLGLDKEMVGITRFCIHPENKFKTVRKIGGTKQLDIEQIKALQPDLIIANKEENERTQIEELSDLFPVWISDINNLDSAMQMIRQIGQLVGKEKEAHCLANQISERFSRFVPLSSDIKTAYFIWRKPYMVAGKATFIDAMLQYCGLDNVVNEERYPQLTATGLQTLNPDLLLLSSEPYPFGQKHIDEFKALLPNAKILLVDGEMFSWYGSRLLYAPEYFTGLLKAIMV
jgi:ABC-type Fe3+-hydroxamate transport system substrate-binding protein